MELEEAKKVLLIIQDKIEYELQFIYEKNKRTELNEYVQAIDTVIHELVALQNLLDEKNEEIEHLQKENKGLKHAVVGIDLDNTYISKDEIRKMKANIQMIANGNKVIENTIKYRVQMALLDDLLKEE